MCVDKIKIDKDFINRGLNTFNIERYLKTTYGELVLEEHDKITDITPFLQDSYGEDGDCTLISILTIVKFYNPKLEPKEIYNYIEKIAKKYLYNGSWGTIPTFNKAIVKKVLTHFNINKEIVSKYIKDVGFNADTIIKQIKNDIPVIISISKDGRNYYDNHTITIIGYNVYKNKENKKIIIFRVYDNWIRKISFLDYQLLRKDCMICY